MPPPRLRPPPPGLALLAPSPPARATYSGPARGFFLPLDAWHAAAEAISERGSSSPALPATDGGGSVVVVCAWDSVLEAGTAYGGGAHAEHPRYKWLPCRDWDSGRRGYCGRGARCDFSHGAIESRVPPPRGAPWEGSPLPLVGGALRRVPTGMMGGRF